MKKVSLITLIAVTILVGTSFYALAEEKKAPDFSLTDPWGYKFSLKQFEGKTVILNFFRIYCGGRIAPETAKQFQELNKVCEEFCKGKNCADGDVVILSITLATCPTTDLKEWDKGHNITWFLGNDYDDYRLDIISSYAEYLKELGDPALIFLNQNQEIVFSSNFLESSQILEKIKELMAVKKPEKSITSK